METGAKEFSWVAQLSDKSKRISWSGESDGTLEQMVLKMAVLGPGAKKDERNIVEVTTFASKQKKIRACICALSVGKTENVPLADMSLFPPVIFTLVEGSGPVHLTASHLVSVDEDEFSDDDLSEYEEEMMESNGKLNTKQKTNGKGDAPMKAIKGKKVEEEEEEEEDIDDDDLDDDDSEEEDEKKIASMKQKISSMLDMEEDDEDDDDMEDDIEEEEEEEKAPAKKRKLANGQAAKSVSKKITSPEKGKKNPPPEQKTPKSQQKSENAQTPKSAKKTPAKPKFNSVEEVKAAISKFPGGKPRKQDKFINWVQNQFKVSEDSWKNDLWKWHKKELGL